MVRTLANSLVRHAPVQVYAQRIDDAGTRWSGRLDRAKSWPPARDPESNVMTEPLVVSALDTIRLFPVVPHLERLATRSSLFAALDRRLYRRQEDLLGNSFARQMEGTALVHRFGGNHMAAATVAAARRLGCPVLITPLAHPGMWDDDSISADAYRRADLVLATTETDARTYEALGVAGDALAICPLPTRAPQRGGGAQLRETRHIDGPIVLFLGRRVSYRGIDELLHGWPTVHSAHPEAVLAFVGPGARLPREKPANVLDIGVVENAEREAWLDAADIVCLPSSGESFGLTLSEAWSFKTPVVTSDLPVLAERVQAAGGGFAVPKTPHDLADAICTLLGDASLSRRLGQAGYDYWLATSTPEQFVQFHLAAYQRLLTR